MHRYLVVCLMVLWSVSSFAAGVPSPSEPRLMIDANGTLLSPTNPLPVNIASLVVQIGSLTAIIADTINTRATLATDSIGLITALGTIKTAVDAVVSALGTVLQVDANLATDSIGLITAINAVKTAVDAVESVLGAALQVDANLATDSIGLLAAINNVVGAVMALGPKTVATLYDDSLSAGSGDLVGAISGRKKLTILNRSSSVSIWAAPGDTATVSMGIEILPRDSFEKDWTDDIDVAIIASEAVDYSVLQEK
jgi:hypothetical protein